MPWTSASSAEKTIPGGKPGCAGQTKWSAADGKAPLHLGPPLPSPKLRTRAPSILMLLAGLSLVVELLVDQERCKS